MFRIIREKSLPSTNTYALELLKNKSIITPTVIIADVQTKGRGQSQNQWFSEEGKSLAFSTVLFPKNIKAERQFVLSQVVCLSLFRALSNYANGVRIKWPNDIYINEKKCCGVLIENALMGEGIAYSVCGIGVNVNNMQFSEGYLATSLYKESGQVFDLESILDEILSHFSDLYEKAEQQDYSLLNSWYHEYLYKVGELCNFEDKDGVFRATVVGIDQYGQLLLEDVEKQLRTYGFKELRWLV